MFNANLFSVSGSIIESKGILLIESSSFSNSSICLSSTFCLCIGLSFETVIDLLSSFLFPSNYNANYLFKFFASCYIGVSDESRFLMG